MPRRHRVAELLVEHAGGTLLAEETVRGSVPGRPSTDNRRHPSGTDSRHRCRSFLGGTPDSSRRRNSE